MSNVPSIVKTNGKLLARTKYADYVAGTNVTIEDGTISACEAVRIAEYDKTDNATMHEWADQNILLFKDNKFYSQTDKYTWVLAEPGQYTVITWNENDGWSSSVVDATVGDGVLTVSVEGQTVASFTANQTDNVELDITRDKLDVYSKAEVDAKIVAPSTSDKVSVTDGAEAGYLNDVLEFNEPLTATVIDNKLHVSWNGTSDNTLTLISNMSLANATIAQAATTGTTSPGTKYGMTLSAFDISSYYNIAQSDVFGIITTNIVQDVTLFKVCIYKLDFDTNQLNLIAISKDFSPYIKQVHGYIEVQVDTIYRPSMNSYGIYYIGVMTDQPSVQVAAGAKATLFNNLMPRMGIDFHNISSDVLLQKIDLTSGKYNDTDNTVAFQESTSRICCIFRHILDDEGDPIVPSPDYPLDPPTPEDPSATYEQDIAGSIYWLQTSCDTVTCTLYNQDVEVAELNFTGEDWTNATAEIGSIRETTSTKTVLTLANDGSSYTGKLVNTNGDYIQLDLVVENSKFVSPSKLMVYRANVEG